MVPSCIWRVSAPVIVALDERLGVPDDAYVNGSQVWLRDDGPDGITVEWRLHPRSQYQRPEGVGVYEVFESVVASLARGDDGTGFDQLWDGLEAFPAYGDEGIEADRLAEAALASLGIPPDAAGLVDHDSIGARWQKSRGGISVVDDLMSQLGR